MEQFKEQLLAEKKLLTTRLKAISDTLLAYGLDDGGLDSIADPQAQSSNPSIFPIKAIREKKIFWLLENHFRKAVKLKEIQQAYNEFTGTEVSIDNISRRQKREGKLVFVRYNMSPKRCYWGLPSWLDDESNNFKEQYIPELEEEIEFSEIVKGDE